MEPKKHRILDHPILFATVFTVLGLFMVAAVSALMVRLLAALSVAQDDTVVGFVEAASYLLVGSLALWLTKRRVDPGYRFFAHNDRLGKALCLLWPFVAVIAINVVPDFLEETPLAASGIGLFAIVLCNLCVGYFEEAMYRGAVLSNAMRVWGSKPNGVVYCLLVSALPFGIVHLTNIPVGGLEATLLQVCYAIAFGALFAAVYLRTRNLLSCALVHGLVDVAGSLYETEAGGAVTIESVIVISVLFVLTLGVAIWYTRPDKRAEIVEEFDALGC